MKRNDVLDWSVSVHSSISSDTEPTVVVAFESGKYVFNAGENMCRSCVQSKRTWRKTRGVWLTSVGTQRCSGLPGLMMFLADVGIQDVQISGPQGLTHYLASMRSYVQRPNMSVTPIDIASSPEDPVPAEPKPIYTDANIIMYGLPLYPDSATVRQDGVAGSTSTASGLFSSKRKRSASPDAPSKRRPMDDEAVKNTAANEETVVAEVEGSPAYPPPTDLQVAKALNAELANVGNAPSLLQGQYAKLWRTQMVKLMFPAEPTPEHERYHLAGKLQAKLKKRSGNQQMHAAPAPPPEPPKREVAVNETAVYEAMKDWQLPHFSYPRDSAGRRPVPVMGYVLIGPQSRGKFDAEKAKALRVPSGPLRGKLTRGETVTFEVKEEDGTASQRTVRPEDCVDPPECPKVMILLDVPDPSYISSVASSFTDSPFYAKLRSKDEKHTSERLVHLIVHLCGPGVIEDPRYREFMNGFPDQTHHMVASRAYCPDPMTFTNAAYNQLRLNKLDPEIFPALKFRLEPERELSSLSNLPPRTTVLRNNETVGFRPFKPPALDEVTSGTDIFHPAVTSSEELLPDKVAYTFAQAQERVKRAAEESQRKARPGDDIIVVPLGTSSAVPTKFRNVLSTFVQIPGYGSILLDAGDGTWGQLARLYEDNSSRQSGVWDVLRDLKCIFLSHMHGDHHIGLAKILAMRKLLNPAPEHPLYVVGLRQVAIYLREQAELEDLGLDDGPNGVITIASETLNWRALQAKEISYLDREPYLNADASRAAATEMCASLGLEAFITMDVRHRTKAFGVVLRHKDGWGVAFSGDTMPSEMLVKAGKDVTLLIHEASMGDDQVELADERGHCTVSQAIDVGKRMKAENILLTHFSARYLRLPPHIQPGSPRRGRGTVVAMAFDHARIRLGDMWKLNLYMPAMDHNFHDIVQMLPDDEEPSTTVSW